MQFEQGVPEIKWTWADLVSSYRFWALFIFFMTVMMVNASFSMITVYLRMDYNLSNVIIGTSVSIKVLFTIIAILPAWLASRAKYYYPLYLFAILIVIGLLLLCFAKDGNNLIFVAMALLGFSIGSISLLIPAYIARAVNSVEVFILSFGVISITNMINGASMTFVISDLISQAVTFNSIIILLVILVVIGTLFLLPVKKCLFNEQPRVREVQPETPSYLDSVLTFLLFFVPFYFIFWFYKVHKDIRNFSQSATLLTPLGASLSACFVPFAMPVMLSILNDVIHQRLLNSGEKGSFKTWLIIVISILFPPIAAAMIQSEINRLAGAESNNTV
ncbi:hypothetical protein MTZ49_10290 [Entomomonas sp. E2T0]|uniref:hypothetical protein n=1 Tax=Entomomonas sp. E2T0 TaxID=2930213 RepID=UPI0022281123|nr:hypothetical protein [Entomomonas sp. E2T0]UYZ82995.1 hypothetical protein MTZ49_10290 [Entomomonas sp. E2T0]